MSEPITYDSSTLHTTAPARGIAAVWSRYGAGLLISSTIGLAAMFVGDRLGGPVMLYALLIGMAFSFVSEDTRFQPGIQFSAKTVLRLGVALLGVRVTLGEIANLGLPTLILIVSGLTGTLIIGWAIGRLFGLKNDHALLSAGAVAICGASAALALSAALPHHKNSERNTILTVVGVTALSTIAMIAYPLIVSMFRFSDQTAGIFIGATIHDVAQVVGAGYTISETAGDTSAIVKLMRVTCLVPVVFFTAMVFRNTDTQGGSVTPLPAFLIGFVCLVILNSAGIIPTQLAAIGSDISKLLLVIAVAALGCKTSLTTVFEPGLRPVLVLTLQTLFLAAFALTGLILFFT